MADLKKINKKTSRLKQKAFGTNVPGGLTKAWFRRHSWNSCKGFIGANCCKVNEKR